MRSLLLKLGLRFAARYMREVAEGKHGPKAQAIYLSLMGKKRWIGLGLGAACVVLAAIGQMEIMAMITGGVAAVMLALGFLDKDWRTAVPAEVSALPIYRFFFDRLADINALSAAGLALLGTCSVSTVSALARVGLTCATGIMVISALAALFTFLGLRVDAQQAPPPAL